MTACRTGSLSVRELIATDAEAAAALWADLLTRDLVGEVAARGRPVDDPLLNMLADRRRARPYLTDGLWVRLIDVGAALRQRRYSCPADLVIEVTDDLLPANAGRWRLQCPGPGDGGTPSCERTGARGRHRAAGRGARGRVPGWHQAGRARRRRAW